MKSLALKALSGAAAAACLILVGTPASAAVPQSRAIPATAAPAATPSWSAPPLKVVKTISSAFAGPLQFAVAYGHIVVADSFTSSLYLVGRTAPIATGPDPKTGGDLAGVAVNPGALSLAYTTSNGDHSQTRLTILQYGRKPVVADLSGFEKKRNPDGRITYGADKINACITANLKKVGLQSRYRGEVDSHPYAVAALPSGAWAVADAGGNDIVKVDRHGSVSLLAVLPAQPLVITAALAAGAGLDPCVVGVTYRFEAVPTDVEVGSHGDLYLTTLPGGPEGPDNGNPGSVYRLDPCGRLARIATGFAGATNLAIDGHGRIFVAEISAGRISEVVGGKGKPVLQLPGVVGVEYADGHLYASTAPGAVDGSGPGTVVLLGPAARS